MGTPRLAVAEPGYRAPPHNIEAEQALLAAIMVNNRCYEAVADFLRPEHFAEGVHGRIYAACEKLVGAGHLANPVTLKNAFDQDGALQEIGGAQYLARLAGSVVTIVGAADYGHLICELWKKRRLIEIGLDLIEEGHSAESRAAEAAEGAETAIYEAMGTKGAKSGLMHIGTAAAAALELSERAWKNGGKVTGITTGIYDLDKMLGGMHGGQLIIVGGRPSMGKTAFALGVSYEALLSLQDRGDRRAGAFFSLETTNTALAQRAMARMTQISADRQRRGHLGEIGDFEKLVEAAGDLRKVPLFLDETAGLSVAQIRQRARRLARLHGIGLIGIDYLQLMRQGGRAENRRLEIGEITGGLKALAKELAVPVILLSQLSRAVEARDDKRPTMADLRESGDIEQDADVILFMFREEYYLSRAEPQRRAEESEGKFTERHMNWADRLDQVAHLGEIIVAKNKDGRTGKVQARWNGEAMKYENMWGHAA